MPPLAGLEHFELRTKRNKNILPLDGTLAGWGDEVEHRVNEHAILGRAGAIHQSNAQGPRRFSFQLLILDDDKGSAKDKYVRIETLLADDPFGDLTHPRFGHVPYVFRGLKATEDLEGHINGLVAELKLDETGLRTVSTQGASIAARAAKTASTTLLNRVASIISRINNAPPPSVADLSVLSPLQGGIPGPIAGLVALGLSIDAAVNDYVTQSDDPSTDQYTLAAQLVQVGIAVENFAASAGTSVSNYPLVSQARMAYGQALAAYQLAAKSAVPIVPRRVPGKMSLARFAQSLYGGGARALEVEILRLNKNQIPYPYAITAQTLLLVPDPAKVRLDDGTSAPALVA